MSYPIYDFNLFPAIEHPFTSEQEATKKYLGSRTVVGEQYATINIFMTSNLEAQALYRFWRVDCENGTIPFMIALPHFGVDYTKDEADITAKFIDDLSMEKIGTHWKSSIRIKIIDIDVLYPSETLYPSLTLYPI